MDDLFYITALPPGKVESDGEYVLCETRTEDDAEEVGAALALAGYNVKVSVFPHRVIHEFFATE
jgi:hypothetical protein